MKYAETIHSSGTDLLALINDILDLSKIESGKMDVEIGSVRFTDLRDYCSRTFRHVADGKSLDFTLDVNGPLPAETIHTDAKRLQQVLKNLLSNALKFTERGSVKLRMDRVRERLERQSSGAQPVQECDRLLGDRYRHRHSAGETENHLRGLPAGGWHHQPQVRRHRSGPLHQPRTGAAAGR